MNLNDFMHENYSNLQLINPSISHNVYVINIQKKTIFHTYDDRGCDVLATSPAAIKEIYTKYSDWILDYDRVEIDKIFE